MAVAEEIYDRQLRLWGHETQSRFNNAHVLIAGLNGINVEAAKCLVLAGIHITVCHTICTGGERINLGVSGFNYFSPSAVGSDAVMNETVANLQALNPFVKVWYNPVIELTNKGFQSESFTDVLCAAESATQDELMTLNESCRTLCMAHFVTKGTATNGVLFSDYGQCHCVMSASGEASSYISFPSLAKFFEESSNSLPAPQSRKSPALNGSRAMVLRCTEILSGKMAAGWSPLVAAVVGALASQEIQRRIAQQGNINDLRNAFCFDADSSGTYSFAVGVVPRRSPADDNERHKGFA